MIDLRRVVEQVEDAEGIRLIVLELVRSVEVGGGYEGSGGVQQATLSRGEREREGGSGEVHTGLEGLDEGIRTDLAGEEDAGGGDIRRALDEDALAGSD